MLQNIVDFKAKSFLTERNTSTMAYEVNAVRALWDPGLSIPGTNRRGGWRCPVGTRYGGQITDRFGRSCGWGVARRIANQISDIGSRLENVDDARRGRRIARRERRILARLNAQEGGAGRLERGLRGVAERLDGAEAPTARGGRRRTVTTRPPSVDAPEAISEPTPDAPRPQRRRRQPARPAREERNLLAAEPTEVLEEMRAELENATGGRDSDDYKRVMAELKRREAPALPARRRQPARRRGGNLRESEQRRMDREIEDPGAPRTGEAPARRRRRAVVEATNNPKAPAKKPEAVVEPKVVKPRRPKPKPGNSDNAARSEELRQAQVNRARGAGQKVDLNQILNERFFGQYIREDVIPNDRIMIINDPANFPNGSAARKTKRAEAIQKINRADSGLNKIEQAIARGELSDNDFIERNGEKINVARVKTYLRDYKDAWREVFDGNVFDTSAPEAPAPKASARPRIPVQPPAPAAPAVDPIDAPFIAPDKKDVRKAPDALKHKAPKIEVAKFTASQEEAIERILLEIADVEKLNKFSLAVDQANFYQNEGRQNALRNYQKRLAEIAKKLRTDPRARMPAQVDAEIAQAKQSLLRSVGGGDITTARARLNQLNNQLEEKFSQLRQPVGVGAEEIGAGRVQTMEQIGLIKQEMGNLEGVIEVLDSLDAEVRKTVERISQGYEFNPDATDIPKPTPQAVKTKIKEQIAGAIDRRQGKLAKYLKERHPQGGAPYEDMTPEKWAGLSSAQKNEYVKQAYSHKLIKGKNGRFYNATAEVRGNSVEVQFNEVNAEGQVIRARIGSSSRQLFYNGNQVYQQSMNVRSKLDRGADIQTIYNQHAFLYLSKIGITSAKVTAADDGQYVWARVGFKQSGGVDRARLQGLVSELRFYEEFGAGGLISNDAEYARISSILKQSEGGTRFYHQDIIFAVDDVDDRARAEYVKQWFKGNMPFGGGVLNFADQKVAGAGRARRPRAPRVRV
jgi:hypothetical protein